MKRLLIIPVMALAACSSSNDVAMNTEYQRSKSQAEQARMEAIAEIAKQGEGGVVAAAMLMQQNGKYQAAAPRTGGDRAVDLAKTIMPALGNTLVGVGQIGATVYAAEVQKEIAINNSNNNKDVAINNSNNETTVATHTNDTMKDIAEVTIVNPQVVQNDTTCVTDATYTCE